MTALARSPTPATLRALGAPLRPPRTDLRAARLRRRADAVRLRGIPIPKATHVKGSYSILARSVGIAALAVGIAKRYLGRVLYALVFLRHCGENATAEASETLDSRARKVARGVHLLLGVHRLVRPPNGK